MRCRAESIGGSRKVRIGQRRRNLVVGHFDLLNDECVEFARFKLVKGKFARQNPSFQNRSNIIGENQVPNIFSRWIGLVPNPSSDLSVVEACAPRLSLCGIVVPRAGYRSVTHQVLLRL